jgi:hypothetical protein
MLLRQLRCLLHNLCIATTLNESLPQLFGTLCWGAIAGSISIPALLP